VLAEQNQAYPILHYYHAGSREKASALAVAVFDEALAIFEDAVVKDYQPEPAGLRSARRTVSSYLQTLRFAYIGPADQPLPLPNLDKLREADVPVVSDEHFAAALEKHSERRRLLLGYLQKDGWEYRSSS
jgi:phosphoribosylamine-glycine ligase